MGTPILTLAHGSDHIIEKPVYGAGKPYNDYGLGFYCTESVDMAKEWGVSEDRDGYANIYHLDTTGLTLLDLNGPSFCILHWLAVLLENRTFTLQSGLAAEARAYIRENFLVEVNAYDLIKGYRADDSYFSFAQDFLNGAISYRQLSEAMRLGKLGQQIVLKSPASFERIQYVGYEVAEREIWYPRKRVRDSTARNEYSTNKKLRRQKGDLYIAAILDTEMKPDDPLLQ